MGKRKLDPGLEYMIALGINPAKSIGGVEEQLEKASDRLTTSEILRVISDRANSNHSEKLENDIFYPLKNKTYKLSMAISSAFDGDILRKACNWIAKNKGLFGNTILEIGCDCGIMSCFLAKTFPDSVITSIDRCKEGIENAKILAQSLGIKNVQFICADVKDISDQYDTVFSMRTVHENHSEHEKEDLLCELDEKAGLFQASLSSYAHIISSRLNEEGLLISIERIGRNALLLGWMQALEEAGLTFHLDEYEELICREVTEESTFEAFVSYKSSIEENASARELFMEACSKYMDFSRAEYSGWDAEIVLAWKRGELIEGYYLEDMTTHARSTFSLWTHKYDETGVIVNQNNEGDVYTGFYDISQKEELIESLEQSINEYRKNNNLKITKM